MLRIEDDGTYKMLMSNQKYYNDLSYWLALVRAPHQTQLKKALTHIGDIKTLFKQASNLPLPEKLKRYLQDPNWASVTADLKWGQHSGHHIISQSDPHYPTLLKEISHPPWVLYVKGNPLLLNSPQLAMVGSRAPSYTGIANAHYFASALSAAGFTITSGLACGIDGESHRAVVKRNAKTIAVLGTGLDTVYPRRHKKLAEQIIADDGALVSEFPPPAPVRAAHFPQRNRIISGMSYGVLIVEAALKSGSLITARCAMEQNREVFTIPGAIQHPLAKGCHQLIKNGAKLVESIDDILEEFTHLKLIELNETNNPQQIQPADKSQLAKKQTKTRPAQTILAAIGYEATPVDTIITRSQLPTSIVNAQLAGLECDGLVIAVPGGYSRKV